MQRSYRPRRQYLTPTSWELIETTRTRLLEFGITLIILFDANFLFFQVLKLSHPDSNCSLASLILAPFWTHPLLLVRSRTSSGTHFWAAQNLTIVLTQSLHNWFVIYKPSLFQNAPKNILRKFDIKFLYKTLLHNN